MTTQTPQWTFEDRLRKAREDRNLKQSDMARLFHVGRSTISNWEAGRNRPDYLALAKWAEVTDVPLEWLDPEGGITRHFTTALIAA